MASTHRETVRKRTTALFLLLLIPYLAIACRLLYVQVLGNKTSLAWAKKIRARTRDIPAARGCIYDRTGRALAVNIETASVFANIREIKDPARTAAQLASLLGKSTQVIEQELNGQKSFVWLGRQLDAEIGRKLWQMRNHIPGIGRQKDTKRVYPAGALAAQIIGFTNIDDVGAEGIEHFQEGLLKGVNGQYSAEVDDKGRVIPETRRLISKPEDGKDIYLTIDTTIQHIAEQALQHMAQKYKPKNACAIVMDPKTGEILALANYPGYDPNKPRSVSSAIWRNRAVADLYEPGSTLKLVTVAAGLNEKIPPHEVVAYCNGVEYLPGGAKVPCSVHHPFIKGHGAVDMYKIIRYSCNIGAAHIAMRLGAEKLYKYEKSFGLLDKTNAGFGCEAVGYMEPPQNWRLIRLADVGFGQGMAVTPLQMASAYATIANGGLYMRPQIIREIRNPDGTIYRAFRPQVVRRVVSKQAADELCKMLVGCVDDGTGQTAKIDGRTVAGKTGSAQVVKTNGRGYEAGAYVASFMGFAPANSPRLVIAVVVSRPQGSHWGATVAAPVFQEIGEKALWYLKVPTDAPTEHEIKEKHNGDKKRLA